MHWVANFWCDSPLEVDVAGNSFEPLSRFLNVATTATHTRTRTRDHLISYLKHLVLYFFSFLCGLWINLYFHILLMIFVSLFKPRESVNFARSGTTSPAEKNKELVWVWLLRKVFLKIYFGLAFCCWSRRKIIVIILIMFLRVNRGGKEGSGNHLKHVRLGYGGPAGCPWA